MIDCENRAAFAAIDNQGFTTRVNTSLIFSTYQILNRADAPSGHKNELEQTWECIG